LKGVLVDGRIILKLILNKKGFEVMHWIKFVQGRGKIWAFLSAIMNVQVP